MSPDALYVTVHCPACDMAEAFNVERLACGQRNLAADAIAVKVPSRGGNRQRFMIEARVTPTPSQAPSWARLWWA